MSNHTIDTTIKDYSLSFETSPECFSPKYIDKGTLALLSVVEFSPTDKVLDLGCGYGVVGILAAKIAEPSKIFLLDNDATAIKCTQQNALRNNVEGIHIIQSDGYKNLDEIGFDFILSNPPYHTDFSVAKMFIEKGFNRLAIGGRFFMVTKRKDWYKKKFIAIFGGVRIYEIDGYFIFEAKKKDSKYAKGRK